MKILGAIAIIYIKKHNDGRVTERIEIIQDIFDELPEAVMQFILLSKAINQFGKVRIVSENYKIIDE
jgi:hypothetical protein